MITSPAVRRVGLLCAGLGLSGLWLAGLYVEPVRGWWRALDQSLFWLFNDSLADGGAWARAWALAGHRAMDVVAAVFYLAVYLASVHRAPRDEHARRLAAGVFVALLVTLILHLSNHWLPDIKRLSPTIEFDGAVRLTELFPDLRIKDASRGSFPGDHGVALMLFTVFTWRYGGRSAGLLALLGAAVFVWPRLVSGAHWASDVMVGSVALAGASVAVVLGTGLDERIIERLERPCAKVVAWFAGVSRRFGREA